MDGLAIFGFGRRGGPRNSGATIRNRRSEVLAFIGRSPTKGLRGASGIPLPQNGRYASMCRINGYKPTYGGANSPGLSRLAVSADRKANRRGFSCSLLRTGEVRATVGGLDQRVGSKLEAWQPCRIRH